MTSQNKQILDYLKKGKSITALDALKRFGCLRLSGRIYDIRKTHKVKQEMVKVGKKFVAKYSLA